MTRDFSIAILVAISILSLVSLGKACNDMPTPTPCEARKCPTPLAPRKLATGRYTTECVCVQLPEGRP